MKIGYYRVEKVGGSPLAEHFVYKDGSDICSVQLGDKRINIDGIFKGGEAKISADYKCAEITFDETPPIVSWDSEMIYPRDLYINIRFKVDMYTIQRKEVPVEMTLDEIEKKLGHKVLITNKSGSK